MKLEKTSIGRRTFLVNFCSNFVFLRRSGQDFGAQIDLLATMWGIFSGLSELEFHVFCINFHSWTSGDSLRTHCQSSKQNPRPRGIRSVGDALQVQIPTSEKTLRNTCAQNCQDTKSPYRVTSLVTVWWNNWTLVSMFPLFPFMLHLDQYRSNSFGCDDSPEIV